MASLNDIVSITISTVSTAVKEPGFGVPMILDYHTKFAERIRFYEDLDAMVADGFATTDSAYKAASAAFAQNPQLERIAIGRRALAPSLRVEITPTVINSKSYKVRVVGPTGASGTAEFVSDATATSAEITAGLTSAISALALSGVTVSDANPVVRIEPTVASNWLAVEVLDISAMSAKQVHADPGIATDAAAVKLENDEWYGVSCTTQGAAEIAALAAWVESNKKLCLQTSQDGDIIGAGSGDIASTLETANYARTAPIFHPAGDSFAGIAWFGSAFPIDPGGLTFKFRKLAGVASVALTATHITNLKAKNCNFFTDYGGVGITAEGVVAVGEFIDVIRDRDWCEARLQARVANVLIGNNKVPFTDGGIEQIAAEVRGQMREAIDAGFLAADPAPVVTVPKVSAVSPSDKAARRLKNVKFSAKLAGAIHFTEITGTISV